MPRPTRGRLQGHLDLPDREGLPRLLDRPADRQGRHAGIAHGRTRLRRLLRARQPAHGPAERRREGADVGARLRARGPVGHPARHHAGLPRRGAALCARAQAVRAADRRVPAHAGQGRRHVCRAERLARLLLLRGQGLRCRPGHALRCGGLHPLRLRERGEGGGRGDPGAGRRRLHPRLAGGTLLARRQALDIGAGTNEMRRMLVGRELVGQSAPRVQ